MESDLHSWKQNGAVSIWRYTEFEKKFGGWHLSADDAGVESLLQLFTALQSEPGAHRTVAITPPSKRLLKVPNYQQGRAKWIAPSKLQLRFSSAPETWELPGDLEPARLSVGASYLPELVTAVKGIPRGEGDFSMGSRDGESLRLWFWWWLDAASPPPRSGPVTHFRGH
jgi:hypothetical protein